MGDKLKIAPGFFLLGALAVLLLPLRWVMGVFLAALVHELSHYMAVVLCGGRILSVSLGGSCARIEASPMSSGREALCALAGPVGSFFMILIAEYFPEAGLCGLIQGAYNLLPLYPLDGGRILRCLFPDAVCFGIRVFTLVLISGLGLWIMTYNKDIGMILLVSLWFPVLQRKFSCKEA